MNKNTINFWTDVLIFVTFVGLLSTGLLMYLFPRGWGSSVSVLGLSRHDWGDIHLIIAVVLLTLTVLHLVLHWDWEKASTKKLIKMGPKTLLLIAAIFIILAIAFPIFLTWGLPAGNEDGKHREDDEFSHGERKGRNTMTIDDIGENSYTERSLIDTSGNKGDKGDKGNKKGNRW